MILEMNNGNLIIIPDQESEEGKYKTEMEPLDEYCAKCHHPKRWHHEDHGCTKFTYADVMCACSRYVPKVRVTVNNEKPSDHAF